MNMSLERRLAGEIAMNNLKGKIAIITGATSGIGKEISLRLIKEGIHIIAVGSRAEDQIPQELKEHQKYSRLTYFRANLADSQQAERLMSFVSDRFNGAHYLIYFAGLFPMDFFTRIGLDVYDRTIRTNLDGLVTTYWHWLKSFENGMIKGKKPNKPELAIFASSVSGLRPYGGNSLYEATKAAVRQFALDQEMEFKFLKKRLREDENVKKERWMYEDAIPRLAVVYPDNVATEMIPRTSGNLFIDPRLYSFIPTSIVATVVTSIVKRRGKYKSYNHIEIRIIDKDVDESTTELLAKVNGKEGIYTIFYPLNNEGNLDGNASELEFLTNEILAYKDGRFVRKYAR